LSAPTLSGTAHSYVKRTLRLLLTFLIFEPPSNSFYIKSYRLPKLYIKFSGTSRIFHRGSSIDLFLRRNFGIRVRNFFRNLNQDSYLPFHSYVSATYCTEATSRLLLHFSKPDIPDFDSFERLDSIL